MSAQGEYMLKLVVLYIATGIGSTMLIYPVTYLILKRGFKYEYRWTTFLIGFGIASTLSGLTLLIMEYVPFEMASSDLFIPLIFSIIVIFSFNAFKKRSTKIKSFLLFFVIYGFIIVATLLYNLHQKKEAIHALSEIQKEYSDIIEKTGTEGFPKRVEKRVDTSPKTRGEFGEIERFVKEFMNQITAQRNDYLLELSAIGWESILDPNRISNDKGFVESKWVLKKASEIVHKYRLQTNILFKKTRDKINELSVGASSKKVLLEEFDKSRREAKHQLETMWDLEEQGLFEIENIINLLAAKKEGWIVRDGQIIFYNENDLKRFNSHIASVQRIGKEQQAIQKKSAEAVSKNLRNAIEEIQ